MMQAVSDLFRSEFIYLEQDHYPTEEEQFQIYKTVAETMAGRTSYHPYTGYRCRQAVRLF